MKNKTTWIIVGIVLAVIILIVGIFAGANNKAIHDRQARAEMFYPYIRQQCV